jgi:hypothetical protein
MTVLDSTRLVSSSPVLLLLYFCLLLPALFDGLMGLGSVGSEFVRGSIFCTHGFQCLFQFSDFGRNWNCSVVSWRMGLGLVFLQ